MQAGRRGRGVRFLRFPSGLTAHLHLSWLDPHKERRFTVVGSRRMATFDDMELERKLTIYDKGFDEDYSSYGEYIARSGDVSSPADLERGAAADRVQALHRARARRAEPRSGGEPGCAWCGCWSGCSRRSTESRHAARPSDPRAPGLLLGEAVELPDSVQVGGTWWCTRARGSGRARLQDGCVIGKPLALGPRSTATGRGRRAAASARARSWAPPPWWWRGGDRRALCGRGPGARARAHGDRRRDPWWAGARRWRTTCAWAPACGCRRART